MLPSKKVAIFTAAAFFSSFFQARSKEAGAYSYYGENGQFDYDNFVENHPEGETEIDHKTGLAASSYQGDHYNEDRYYLDLLHERQDTTAGLLAVIGPIVGVAAAGASFVASQSAIADLRNQVNSLSSQLQSARSELTTTTATANRATTGLAATDMTVATVKNVLKTTCDGVSAIGGSATQINALTGQIMLQAAPAPGANDQAQLDLLIDALLNLQAIANCQVP